MFEYMLSGRSEMNPLTFSELFEDVKLVCGSNDLSDKGYIRLYNDNVGEDGAHMNALNLGYMVKPTQAVVDYMVKSGRGMPYRAIVSINKAVAFTAYWDCPSGFETKPRIAGVIDANELAQYKQSAELVGECVVTKAYKNFKTEHPNFALKSIRQPTGTRLQKVERLATLVWVAVGYKIKDNSYIDRANSGEFKSFYLNVDHLNTLRTEFGINT